MADWRQIQARIRKAKASTDAAAKLAELYEQTRDAMVAFELARWQEKAGEHAEAARWYTAAAERFRRSQWKTKAQAALARLRAPSPAGGETTQGAEAPPHSSSEDSSSGDTLSAETSSSAGDLSETQPASEIGPDSGPDIAPDIASPQPDVIHEPIQRTQSGDTATIGNTAAEESGAAPGERRPRRRGRRGGRNRRRTGKGIASGAAPVSRAAPVPSQMRAEVTEAPSARPSRVPPPVSEEPVPELKPPASPSASSSASPVVPSNAAWQARSRAGEPALASRMAHLESQLRRLLACPQSKLEQAESAPAGPGVLLLSDSDQVSHYYVESCQTLRIAIGNIVRGGRGAKDPPRLKETLAENLGIAESRVTNYLKEHCAVRWLQLDEGAPELAHFAIAVLRPVVNE
jgi:hypothetical protein